MADLKISQLPSATTPLAGTEVLPIVQSSATKQVSVNNLTAGKSISAASATLTTGNLVIGTSGKGIDFSATGQAGGMTSELLNDYEEGTWTPVYTPAAGAFATMTMNVISATYTKIGNKVLIEALIRTSNVDITGASGSLTISGLPFSPAAWGSAAVTQATTTSHWGTNRPLTVFFQQGNTSILMYYRTTVNGADQNINVTDLATGAHAGYNDFVFSGTYITS